MPAVAGRDGPSRGWTRPAGVSSARGGAPIHPGRRCVDLDVRSHRCPRTTSVSRVRSVGASLSLFLLACLAVSITPAGAIVQSRPRPPGRSGPFAWLTTSAAPADWQRAVLPSGEARVSYPPSFTPLVGDTGTVSATVRDVRGRFLAYINVTPRQGDEKLKGFGSFRVGLLRDEDPMVIQDATQEGLRFHGGLGSCVIDHYVTRIDHNRYREVACLVQGRHGSAVVVAAAMEGVWRQFGPVLQQVIASFTVH
jgi:hypothetical protein